MGRRSLVYGAVISAFIILVNIIFIFMPGAFVITYNNLVRPGVYALLVIALRLLLGRDSRPVRKVFQANMTAVISVVMYASMIMLVSFFFGGGRNVMTPNAGVVMRNIWPFVFPLVCGEYIRFRLIKSAGEKYRILAVAALTFVLALSNLDGLRALVNSTSPNYLNYFFESVLPALTISAVLSFMCIKGSFASVLVVSFVYNLGGIFSPLLPTIDRIVWALTVCILVFIAGVIYYYLTDDNSAARRKRISRAVKYAPRNPVLTLFNLGAAVLSVAFFLQFFVIYPVVILTGSMTGTMDRGSLVIMRRIPYEEVYHRVEVGTVLHYHVGRVEFVHRVIDFTYSDGERLFVTKGDANEFPDPGPLAQVDVIGTPIFTIPLIGYPNVLIRSVTGGFF